MKRRSARIAVLGSLCAGILVVCYFFLFNPQPDDQSPSLFEAMRNGIFYPTDFVYDFSRIHVDAEGIHHQNQAARFVMLDGWSSQTEKGVWGIGNRSRLEVFFQNRFSRLLYLECRPFLESEDSQPQILTILLNDTVCDTVTLKPHWDRYEILLPESAFLEGSNILAFSYAFSTSPQELDIGSDLRQFAARFRKIGFFQVRGEQKTFTVQFVKKRGDFLRKAENIRVTAFQDQAAVFFDRSGSLVFPLQLPGNASYLEFTPEDFRSWENSVWLSVHIEPLGGERKQLISLSREDFEPGISESVQPVQISVQKYAGLYCFVTFRMEAQNQAPQAKLTSLQISHQESLPRNIGAGSSQLSETVFYKKSDYPDIVVIILDAARADHFGCYGYGRDTTPHIDSLARDGLIFTHAYATAPYTVCSVPSMITGASFFDHGVVRAQDKLNEDMTTLAESLRAAGYTTLGFSSTPNNSRTKGFDQGFDEFYEAWAFVEDRKNSRNAFQLSRRVIQSLQEQEATSPLFLQVHYVPPHEPYEPGEQHDIFGDPEYQGRMNGSIETLSALKLNRTIPADRDIKELISLYDGNLRMADFALEELLQALRQRKRWPNTLLLITSDHGEALYEHGRLGHNSTLYEEMLHVPFILHLPEDFAGGGEVDEAQLVSLEDIVPTVLGLLSIQPESYVAGVNIFEQPRAWQPGSRPRFIFSRSSGDPVPFYSYRSRRWKVIFRDAGSQQLFDLFEDPDEVYNLVHRKPEIYSGFLELLSRELSQKRLSNLPAGKATMSKEEEAALKSLGYIK